MRKLSMDELNRISVQAFKEIPKNKIVIVLDNIRSMHNVGSVFRTADSFLVEAICLCGYTPQPPHRDIQKTALGATESVDWLYFENTNDCIVDLQNRGYKMYCVEQAEQSFALQNFTWNSDEPVALVFGNEVDGVDQNIINQSNGCIEIPQSGTKHSLNISVAAGVVLWHFYQQTMKHGDR
jgi:23S rRNA (guanosine2251-2'-O)-methyltransferase